MNNAKLINCLAAGIRVGNDSNIYNSNSYSNGSSSGSSSISNTTSQRATDTVSSTIREKDEGQVKESPSKYLKMEGNNQFYSKRKNPISGAIEIWGSEMIQKEFLGNHDGNDAKQE